MKFKQIPIDQCPKVFGKETFSVKESAQEINQKFGIQFTSDYEDGLGEVDIAVIEYHGNPILLIYYKQAPEPFTLISFPLKSPFLSEKISKFLSDFPMSVTWTSPLI